MKIFFYASFRSIVGQKEFKPGFVKPVTIKQTIAAVLENFPQLNKHWLDQNQELLPHVHISLNGVDVDMLENGYDTLVHSGDELDFFPPIQGGWLSRKMCFE